MDRPATFHGPTFRGREESLRTEIASGLCWRPRAVASEHDPLLEILMVLPDPAWEAPDDPDRSLHLAAVDFGRMRAELERIAETYRTLGVSVHLIDGRPDPPREGAAAGANCMFVRDVFWMTQEGAVIARMGALARRGEEPAVAAAIAARGTPILRTVGGTGTFEGADAVWASRDTALVGVGNRTNEAGFAQVREVLAAQGVDALRCVLPRHVQHLAGVLAIMDRDLAIAPRGLVPADALRALREHGIEVREFAWENGRDGTFGLDLVTVAPGAVVLGSGAGRAVPLLDRLGIEVVARVPTGEIRKAAGGLNCATGILSREARA